MFFNVLMSVHVLVQIQLCSGLVFFFGLSVPGELLHLDLVMKIKPSRSPSLWEMSLTMSSCSRYICLPCFFVSNGGLWFFLLPLKGPLMANMCNSSTRWVPALSLLCCLVVMASAKIGALLKFNKRLHTGPLSCLPHWTCCSLHPVITISPLCHVHFPEFPSKTSIGDSMGFVCALVTT